MSRVLRVEHIDNGYGCYCGFYAERSEEMETALLEHSSDMERWPVTTFDTGINRFSCGDERHGFLNKKQLHSWFTKRELKIMWDSGFAVMRYDGVTITAVGEKQILFTHESFEN